MFRESSGEEWCSPEGQCWTGVRCVSCMGESAADGEGKSSLCHSLQRVFMFTASMKIFQLRNMLCKTLIFVLLCSMAPHHFPLQYLKRKSRWQFLKEKCANVCVVVEQNRYNFFFFVILELFLRVTIA